MSLIFTKLKKYEAYGFQIALWRLARIFSLFKIIMNKAFDNICFTLSNRSPLGLTDIL